MTVPARNVYSPQRLKVVLALLTLVTLPVVAGISLLIYQYLQFGVMVDRRLQGERWMVPSKVYARPLVLHEGLPLPLRGFLKSLNALKYEQRGEGDPEPGQFVAGEKAVSFHPRPQPGAADEPVLVSFEPDRVKDLRGTRTKKKYKTQALEPELVTYLFDESREKRRIVRYDELPEHLIKAVLAIEDRRFFSHPGLDPFRIAGAAIRNFKADSYVQGGSTITQQLCKNFFLTPERTVKRKLQEALIAFVLERRADKKAILELYLNEIYLGQNGSFSINGVGEAARMYFHKDVGNLTLPESALLAGMIQSPNPYNPFRHKERATERRNVVIRAMNDAGFIDEETMRKEMEAPLLVERGTVDTSEAPYFVDLVRAQLHERYDARNLTTQNLSIHTSIDLPLQTLAQEALARGLDKVEKMIKRKGERPPVQGSLIALEPASGAVVAVVGGRSYGSSQYNRVTEAKRQPGSTFKPFVYLAAFEATFDDAALPPITPATVVEDAHAVFFYEDKEYIPQNYEDKYLGYVTLRRALANSLNVATVKVAEMVGYDRVVELWAKKLAIDPNIQAFPALALGAFEATPYQMATAYNVLANGGLKIEPVTVLKVTDDKGQVIEQYRPEVPKQVVRPESAFLVTNMLRSVINEGTAASVRAAGFAPDAAGKTGTNERPARRLVRGLHAGPAVRRVGRLRRQHARRPLGHARRAPDLGRFHEGGARGPARHRVPAPAGRHRLRRDRQGDGPARHPPLPQGHLGVVHPRDRAPGALLGALTGGGERSRVIVPAGARLWPNVESVRRRGDLFRPAVRATRANTAKPPPEEE
jgi:penicillin-binding protein 1B